VVAAWWWLRPSEPPGPIVAAHIEVWSGDITSTVDGAHIPVTSTEDRLLAGTVLETGSVLETGNAEEGKNLRLAMRLTSGSSVRLAPGSRVRLESATVLHLERGALYVDSGVGPERGAPIEVRTPFGTATDIGTQFEVRLLDAAPIAQHGEQHGEQLQEALRVRVREGEVEVTGEGETYSADAGVELTLSADGEVHRAEVDIYGDPWAWVMDAAPALEIEGITVREFLAWTARETGWQVRYQPAELEAQVGAIVLRGAAGELSPRWAPSVLPSAGLDGEVIDGTLLVTRSR
jgi:ferric-dicitrate binding protein FerR (iron transport regulator)